MLNLLLIVFTIGTLCSCSKQELDSKEGRALETLVETVIEKETGIPIDINPEKKP